MGILSETMVAEPTAEACSKGSRRGMLCFSVTTWIIIACVAIFVIDGFQSYSSWVETGTRYVDNGDGTWREEVANPNLTSPTAREQRGAATGLPEINLVTRTIRSSRRPSLGCR